MFSMVIFVAFTSTLIISRTSLTVAGEMGGSSNLSVVTRNPVISLSSSVRQAIVFSDSQPLSSFSSCGTRRASKRTLSRLSISPPPEINCPGDSRLRKRISRSHTRCSFSLTIARNNQSPRLNRILSTQKCQGVCGQWCLVRCRVSLLYGGADTAVDC